MIGTNGGLFLQTKLSSFCALVLRHTVMLLLLSFSCRGQSEVVGPSPTIVALVGDDVMLPCRLEPALNAVSKTVEWARPDLTPRFVHVWHKGQIIVAEQNPSYNGRTSVSTEKLRHGDLSLGLSTVKHSDNGQYRCSLPSERKHSTVELVVGSVSSPVIAVMNINNSALVLQCRSEGWYPEPEVVWLDGEGNLLPAGPTETTRGPGDLYTVSSRVTVEKTPNNRFTCRVHQRNINQTRESAVLIIEDVFTDPSSPGVRIVIVMSVVFLLSSVAVFVFWKWRQTDRKHSHSDTATEEREQLVDSDEEKPELDQKLKEREEEKTELINVISVLTEQKKELENTRDKLRPELEEVEKKKTEKEKELEKKNKIYNWNNDERKMMLSMSIKELSIKKTEYENSLQRINDMLQTTEDTITTITQWKNKVETQIEQMKKQPEETKRRGDEETKRRRDETQLQSEQREREEETKEHTESLNPADTTDQRHSSQDELQTKPDSS